MSDYGSEAGEDHLQGISDILRKGSDVEIVELDKTGHVGKEWLHTADDSVTPVQRQQQSDGIVSRSFRGWRQAIFDSFLPVGFPYSVSDDYLAYQFYDSLQAFFSTITSLLANRALLQGLGVGDGSSSATFAMLLTILKDAMSRIATIIFAHRFGLRIEPDAKRYRFLADLFNDTAFFLELYSPYLSPWNKALALGTGEALRALCGVAAGASKAALSVHFARHDNLAELNAKEASQETAVGLIGLLVGTLVVKFVEDHTTVVCLMIALVFGHLWVNYLGVRSVHMTTLNRQRATIVFREYLKTGNSLSPKEVAKWENILFSDPVIVNRDGQKIARIEMAESYEHARSVASGGQDRHLIEGHMFSLYIGVSPDHSFMTIRVLLWEKASSICAITAWFNAMELAWNAEKGKIYLESLHETSRYWNKKIPSEEDPSDRLKKRYYEEIYWHRLETAGWDVHSQCLETGPPVRVRFGAVSRKTQ